LCHLQHKLIGFYNRDEKCLQRGTDWVFKYSGLRFVFKGLSASPSARAARYYGAAWPNAEHRNIPGATLSKFDSFFFSEI
jgi:hypothetical protein